MKGEEVTDYEESGYLMEKGTVEREKEESGGVRESWEGGD